MSTSASAQPRHVFVRNGQIFTSLTSNYLPDIPVQPLSYEYDPPYSQCLQPQAINQSREGFLVVMAYISYLITMFYDNLITALPHESDFLQWEHILQQSGISQEIIQDLKRSEICEFNPSYPRVGVFIKYDNWTFHRTLQKCVKYGVPVWVHWPSADQWSWSLLLWTTFQLRRRSNSLSERRKKRKKNQKVSQSSRTYGGPGLFPGVRLGVTLGLTFHLFNPRAALRFQRLSQVASRLPLI